MKKLHLTKAPPILFVGSGLSRRYLSTPSWDGLLKMFAEKIDDNPLAYEMYYSEASSMEHPFGINPKVAELIEKDFNKKWYRDDEFSESRKKFAHLAKEKCSPFKIEIAEYFTKISDRPYNSGMDKEIELLHSVADRSIGGIITTNYDSLIERVVSGYKYSKYIGQEELIFSPLTDISEIYKIHGCCSEPKSIVINEKDYKLFNAQNDYLIAKLLTIFMEHPMIFIGYSISDTNIRDILTSMSNCLTEEKLEKLKDRFIFIEWNSSGDDNQNVITPFDFAVGNKKAISMTKVIIDDYSCIYEALLQNKVFYNPRLIKKMRNDIYNVVLSSESSETLNVLVDVDDDRLDEVETVVGFGLSVQLGLKGYKPFLAEDLFEDVIYENKLNKQLIVNDSLPNILKITRNVPLFKYTKDYEGELPTNVKKWVDKTDLDKILTHAMQEFRKKNRDRLIKKSIADMRKESDLENTLKNVSRIDYMYLNSNDLHELIIEYMEKHPDCLRGENQFEKNDLKRLIRLYDYLKYKVGK